jgi:hypothetical protein
MLCHSGFAEAEAIGLALVLEPSRAEVEADLGPSSVVGHFELLLADHLVGMLVQEVGPDQRVTVVVLEATGVLGLAAWDLGAVQAVPEAVGLVDHKHYQVVAVAVGMEHKVPCWEDHTESRAQQYLVWWTHTENSRCQAFVVVSEQVAELRFAL